MEKRERATAQTGGSKFKQEGEYIVGGVYKIHPHYIENEECVRNRGWLVKGRVFAKEFKDKYFSGKNGISIFFVCPICGEREKIIIALSSGGAMVRWWLEDN